MKSVIKTARTVEEAVQAALQELRANRDEVTIDVLEEPARGLFGLFGSKDAVVRVSVEDNVKEEILRDLRLPYVSKEETPERRQPKKEKAKETKKETKRDRTKEEPKREPVKTAEKKVERDKKKTERKTEETPVPTPENKQKPEIEEADKEKEIPPFAEETKEDKQEQNREISKEKTAVGKPVPVRLDNESEEAVVEIEAEGEPSVILLRQMLEAMDLQPVIKAEKQGQILHLHVSDIPDNKAGLVIGRRGETLDAMQYLITLASHKKDTGYRKVVVDINEYRKKRDDSLRQLAVRSAEKVMRSNRNMRLEPMNPYERRIIHSELQKMDGVHTVSEGQEPYRRIVIRVNRNR